MTTVTLPRAAHTPESLRAIAARWQEKADHELGKSRENGWPQWALDQAMRRRDYCLAKRDACLTEATRVEVARGL